MICLRLPRNVGLDHHQMTVEGQRNFEYIVFEEEDGYQLHPRVNYSIEIYSSFY